MPIAKDGLPARDSGAWATDKLHYVGRYQQIFAQGMAGKWHRAYVDLLAGPGRCITDTGQEFDGSPLRAYSITTPFDQVICVEQDPELLAALTERLVAAVPLPLLLPGDCNDPAIVRRIRHELPSNALVLVFIDLLALDVRWRTLEALTSDRRMDLLMTFQVNDVFRNVRAALVDDPRHGPRFDAFFGDSSWRAVARQDFHRGATPAEVADRLVEHYCERLTAIGYVARALLHRLMRSETNAPLYRLLLASKHPRGAEFFQKIATIDSRGQRDLPW